MIADIQALMDRYTAWLREKITLRKVGEWVEITTPYLDRHNDYLQIYVKDSNGAFVLSDDGYVIEDLRLSGCKLDSRKRQDLLRVTLNGFGVQQNEDALTIKATTENFALRKHSLVQAMLAVNDMFYMAAPTVSSLFFEDVIAWLDENEVRYIPKVKFTGKSGYDHVFDIAIPKSKRQPERILRVMNHPDRDAAQALAFSWIDTKEVRAQDSRAYAILNDTESKPSAAVIDALTNYDVSPVLWSGRNQVREKLVA
ncbi:MAG TPA: DUF1829 domain-containing protein [Tepidisphaeraceae bacterium]|nr:DUF1829 domain-containing protein [Tepidisphaeraceae bacterium]